MTTIFPAPERAEAPAMVPVNVSRILTIRDAVDGLDASDAVELAEELLCLLKLTQHRLERQDFQLSADQAAGTAQELYDLAGQLQGFALRVLEQS